MGLDLEDSDVVHPRRELGQGRLAHAAGASEKHVAVRLAEHSIDSEDVVADGIEDDKLGVVLLLGEDAEFFLEEAPKLLELARRVVAREERREVHRALEHRRRQRPAEGVAEGEIDVLVGPGLLVAGDEFVAEDAKAFVDGEADELLRGVRGGECVVHRLEGGVDGAHPPGQFTRGVDVVFLNLGGEPGLGRRVEIDHGLGDGFRGGFDAGASLEDGAGVGGVDPFERFASGEVDEENGRPAEEAVGQGEAAGVGWWIAGSDELNVLNGNPRVVGWTVETAVFDDLAKKLNNVLSFIFVWSWKIDFVAEDDQFVIVVIVESCCRISIRF